MTAHGDDGHGSAGAPRRSGGRAGRARRPRSPATPPRLQPVNTDRPTEPLDEEGVLAIHDAAMRVLEETGIEFLNAEARAVLAAEGCRVDPDGPNVRMDRDWLMARVAQAPESFRLIPRNPDRAITIGAGHMAFTAVASPPNVMDLDRGHRPGDFTAFEELTRLTQAFDCLHMAGGYPVEPVDLPAATRHLDCLFATLTLTDKVPYAYSLGPERVEDALEMARLATGMDATAFFAEPRIYTNINSSSPLKHDWPMLDGAMRFARRGQPVIVTPFTLAGAMAPVTMAGAVVLSVAECLAAVALLQAINPGTPCVMGSFTSNVDMRSGAPAFGTPEYMRATQMAGQMARFYRLPLRASNACASNAPDAQAMWESMNSLWAAVQAGVSVVFHGAGWLEGGLIASFEKFVMDCEVIGQIGRYFDPVLTDTGPDALAVEAIAEVGAQGNFFGAAHTRARYETAFYTPFLSDWSNHPAWVASGSLWTAERANRVWRQRLADHTPPPMDAGHRAALAEYVARRKAEGGAVTDF